MALASLLAAGVPPAIEQVGQWDGTIDGVPGGKLAPAPMLGNGYLGVLMSYNTDPKWRAAWSAPLDGAPMDFWINSNANWGCEPTGQALPPARCSVRVLGGFSLSLADRSGAASVNASFGRKPQT